MKVKQLKHAKYVKVLCALRKSCDQRLPEKTPDSPDCVCTSGDLLSFSPNRVFVVETFAMLISQKQALVSSDTSCAVGNESEPFFFF